MKKRRLLLKHFSIAVIISTLLLIQDQKKHSASQQNPKRIPGPLEMVTECREKIRNMEPNSSEAIRLARRIDEIQRKASSKVQRAENPGAFLEALAAVKTTRDGKTYPPNYRINELRRAKRYMSKKMTPLPWKERGPGNVSGRARAIIVDPDDPSHDTWFVASIGGGIWKTTNAGITWENKTPELTSLSTTTMAMAGSNHDVIYAGTGMGYGRVVDLAGSGVWKSTDHGETWFQLQSTANGELMQAINRIVVDPDDENMVLVCSNDTYTWGATKGGTRRSGIFRSTDGGISWTQVFDPDAVLGTRTDNRIQQIIANPKNFNTLYATVNEVGVIKSTDRGLNWFISADYFALPRDIGSGDGTYRGISVRTELAISPTDTSRLYAAVERPYGVADLYMTTDGGTSWTLINDTGDDPNWFNAWGLSGETGSYTSGWFNNTIVVHPYNKNIVFVGGVNMYRIDIDEANRMRTTTLIADHWRRFPDISYVHGDHHFLVTIPVDEATDRFRIVDANDGGVGFSNDGGVTWTHITGMGTTQFYGVDKKPDEDVYIGGMQDNGTYHSSADPDALSFWTVDLGGDGIEVAWNDANPDLILGCTQYGRINRSTDGGSTWYLIPDAKAGEYAPFLTKIASSNLDPDLVFTVGSDGVKRSDDFGASWSLTPVLVDWLGFRAFDNVEISLADPQIVWISSRINPDPCYQVRGGIHVSKDGGFRFQKISQNLPSNVIEASGIGTHPFDANEAYLLFSAPDNPKIMRTTDLGQTWEDISGFDRGRDVSLNGFPDVAVFSLLVMPYDTHIIWAGTEIGLFISNYNGQSWQYSDNGLPPVGIFEMKIVDRQIVVATQGRGIWTVDLPEMENYDLPEVTLSPRVGSLTRPPIGNVLMEIQLRSPYDSSLVMVDDRVFDRMDANSATQDTTLFYPTDEAKTIQVYVKSFKGDKIYRSSMKSVYVFPTQAQSDYSNNLNSSNTDSDFIVDGFTLDVTSSFPSRAFHSAHPYSDGQNCLLMLKVPIQTSSDNDIFQYDDVALVEPGDPGSQFGDYTMWDYVIVEGTKDGREWIPLIHGYDARANRI